MERPEITDKVWGFATSTPSLASLLEAAQHPPPHSLTPAGGAPGAMADLLFDACGNKTKGVQAHCSAALPSSAIV